MISNYKKKQLLLHPNIKMGFCIFILFFKFELLAQHSGLAYMIGVNITEMGYDTRYYVAQPPLKSQAQIAIDQASMIGFKHIVLNVRAHMIGPRSSDIRFLFQNEAEEITGLRNIVLYAKNKGLTVGIRPILLVLGPNREFPYIENKHIWWHGNIKPANPLNWFKAFEKFVLFYAIALKNTGISEFTIGAEMQSMMVGMGNNDDSYLMGQPEKWLNLLYKIRELLPQAKLTYDINFPETLVVVTGNYGGELERWRHLIVDLDRTTKPMLQLKRKALIKLWKEFDFIGIDFYRYLNGTTQNIPTNYSDLVRLLTVTALSHATQIDNALSSIEMTTGISQNLIIKEIGYRSVKNCFVNPASYTSSGGELNVDHQAASYQAIAEAFLKPRWPWMKGIYLWEISTNNKLVGSKDIGYSPIGKDKTLDIIKSYYLR